MSAAESSNYPAEWETTALLKDGATVQVRPIRPVDREALARFHSRQSRESIYFRFFRYRPELSEQELSYFTEIDYEDRMAFVAILGDEIVAVARYEKDPKANEAEVAFFVDDEHHGRGLATLMLEYLAEAGRRIELDGFTATVLSENYRMLRVFRHAGFDVSTRFEDGSISVDLGLVKTAEVRDKIEDRDRLARVESVRRVFSPSAISVVGASRTPGTVGHEFVKSVVQSGFSGTVTAVNPNADETIAGAPAVRSISDVKEMDLVVLAIPATQVLDAAKDSIEEGARTLLVAAGGFRDGGEDGADLEAQLFSLVRRHGVRLVGPMSYGLINTDPERPLSCEFFPIHVESGGVALLSQSGPLGAALLGHLNDQNIGVSTFLSLGDRADLSPGDLLEFWAEDDRTRIGALYLENLGNPQKFVTTGRRVSRRKPVVSLRPTNPHLSVVAESAGLILVDGVSELLDQIKLLDSQPVPLGNRVGLVSNMASVSRLAEVGCHKAGLEVVASVAVPHTATSSEFESRVVQTAVDAGVDSIIVAISPTLRLPRAEVNKILIDVDQAVDKPVVAVNLTGLPAREGPPVYAFPDEAVRALGRYTAYGDWLAAADSPELSLGDSQAEALSTFVHGLLGIQDPTDMRLGSEPMSEFVGLAGVSITASKRARSVSEAIEAGNELGFPVAVKADWLQPRTPGQLGGTVLDVADVAALTDLLQSWRLDEGREVVVQPMTMPGRHLSVCFQQRPDQGSTMSVSLGGAAAAGMAPLFELALPATHAEIDALVTSVPGLRAGEADQLRWFVSQTARVATACKEISAWEMNPVLVSDTHAAAVEASVSLRSWPEDPLRNVRHL